MAYRFLLEVPEALSEEAHVEIGGADSVQIVVTRPSFASGYDRPYAALTIAAHNLRVIDLIYTWYESFPPTRPELRIVLNTGQRVSLTELDRGEMVAAIRRDQPWVERTIPKIGDHAEDEFVTVDSTVGDSGEARDQRMDTITTAPARRDAPAKQKRAVVIEGVNFIAIRVADLAKAERFYTDFFAMEIVGRTRLTPERRYELLPHDYEWREAVMTDTQADDTYLRNGPLALTLRRVGLGARLDRDLIDRISIQVDGTTYNKLKANVLMRSFELLSSSETSFTFRDPYSVPWEVTLVGALPELIRTSFELDF
jgi:catechol 2,3-dioxygenase-like lactoylglutathione lyase family enzyme